MNNFRLGWDKVVLSTRDKGANVSYRHGWMAYALLIALASPGHADIFRWDNGQLIPDTEGITPGPGVLLNNRNLEYADLSHWILDYSSFSGLDLTGAQFDSSNLSSASFYVSNLTNANLTNANLTGANLGFAMLRDADLSGAVVAGADFGSTTNQGFTNNQGFTKEQLYSTASYQAKDLRGIRLSASSVYFYPGPRNDLTGWDFSGQDLRNADLDGATLTNANFTGAVVSWARLRGFTKEQLYSTASYQAKELQGITLWFNDLTGWDFSEQNLTDANLDGSTLVNADLTGADVTAANLGSTGVTKEQLYSTASYQAADLRGINLEYNDLRNWNLSGQNLTGASLTVANLTGADLTGAVVAGADLAFTTSRGLTKEMLYSTASYQAKDLHGIRLSGILSYEDRGSNLSGWDFSGQDLTSADLHAARLTNADLRDANLNNARLNEAELAGADTRGAQGLDLAGAVIRNTILPNGSIAGLDLTAGASLIVRNYDGNRPIVVGQHLAMDSTGTLRLVFDADGWGSTISFAAGIPVTRGGTLELTFAPGVDVATQSGRTIDLFDWTGVTPTGALSISSPYTWNLNHLYTTGEVTLSAAPIIPGDYNLDGTVDAADYVVWRKTDGTPAGYNVWRAHFGQTLGSGAALPSAEPLSAAVPEPSAASIVLVGILALAACRRLTILRLRY